MKAFGRRRQMSRIDIQAGFGRPTPRRAVSIIARTKNDSGADVSARASFHDAPLTAACSYIWL
jgi:hypothetical protein